MKAIILAAGKGSRLGEITQAIPKPMIEFRGKPILLHNIELCKRYGVTDIYINTSHLASRITDYFKDGSNYGVNIKYSYEQELLGTAGALNNFKEEICTDDFFVIYGDNFSEVDLFALINKKDKNPSLATIAFHYREDVSSSGVAEFDEAGRILKFIEKPLAGETESHWVNAGIYLLSAQIFNYIPNGFSDFGKDIFPELLNQSVDIYGHCFHNDVLAFDTPETYNKNILH